MAEADRDDLSALLCACISVPLIWILLLGWDFRPSLGTNDATSFVLIFVRELVHHGGDWLQTLYRPDVVGGIRVHDVVGTLPLYQWLSALGAAPLTIVNAVALFLQLGMGFFSYRLAFELLLLWGGALPRGRARFASLSGVVILGAFSPVLAWRIFYGHADYLMGMFVLISAAVMVLSVRNRRFNLVLLVVTCICLMQAFPTHGQQTIVYSFVFGMPILLALACPSPFSFRGLAGNLTLPGMVVLAGFLFALPKTAGMFQNALGQDSARSLHAESVTYSYTTSTTLDWLASIPWTLDLLSDGRELYLQHETNMPFGPMLLLLVPLVGCKGRALAWGLGVSVVLVLCFSMNLEPLSSVLPMIFPPLGSFRVPSRAMLPFALMLPAIGCAVVLHRFVGREPEHRSVLPVGVLAALCLFLLPGSWREAAAWGFVAFLCAQALADAAPKARLGASTALLVLAMLSVAAFKERRVPFPPMENLVDLPRSLGRAVTEVRPQLSSPLTRVRLNLESPEFSYNTGFAAGLSTLDGYSYPTSRFLRLWSALSGEPADATHGMFDIPEETPGFGALQQLYNVCCAVDTSPQGLLVRDLPPTPGESWFSATLEYRKSLEELATTLRRNAEAGDLKRTLWVVSSDPRVGALEEIGASDVCARSSVSSVRAVRGGQRFTVHVDSPATCPLTLATNYSTILRATGEDASGRESPLRLFPGYGALTSVIVPEGTKAVTVFAVAYLPWWARVLQVAGLAGMVGAALWTKIPRRPPRADPAIVLR